MIARSTRCPPRPRRPACSPARRRCRSPRSRPAPTARPAAGSGGWASAPGCAWAGSSSSSEPRCSRRSCPSTTRTTRSAGSSPTRASVPAATCSAVTAPVATSFPARSSGRATRAIIIGTLIGGLLGLLGGYYRGRVDTFIVGLLDILLSFPALVLALALVAVLQDRVSDLLTLVLALGIISIPVLARITRANALVWSQREFVMAARAQGAKDWRIMIREVLPNVLPSAFSIALLGVAVVIVAEAGLGTLGVGLSTQSPTWGNIINDGRSDLTSGTTPHIVFVGAAMVFLTVLALNYLGDVVRARFDVREAGI
ncbi:MAG: ABC transporter permease [Actinobacteria bacterium]|nr:MAG: ABC transporter permease [Actinomycetota bacterium]